MDAYQAALMHHVQDEDRIPDNIRLASLTALSLGGTVNGEP